MTCVLVMWLCHVTWLSPFVLRCWFLIESTVHPLGARLLFCSFGVLGPDFAGKEGK